MPTCPAQNTTQIDPSSFWSSNGNVNWDMHRIGWVVAGACTAVTVTITIISVLQHCRNYNNPAQQRQILRILYMPPIYAIISFFSYQFFRDYTYYALIEVCYEAVTLSAFLLLIIDYVATTATGHSAEMAIERKDKRPLPIPFCCMRYRPTKAYFMYTVKWSVMQYVIVRPAVSIIGVICEHYNVLCESAGFSFMYANVYLEIVDFCSSSTALYGLLVFYGLTSEELEDRRPLAKFLSIKLIVMFTFYQSFVFTALEGIKVITGTPDWSETDIANGLNALAICIETVFFSGLMWWAYNVREYRKPGAPATSVWRPLWDSINYTDFVLEILTSLRFFIDYAKRKPNTHGRRRTKMNFGEAFGVAAPRHQVYNIVPVTLRGGVYESTEEQARLGASSVAPVIPSYDEHVRLVS